ncbi:FG-GAP-like repeat-containing protein [Rheinheimera soli]|uniref:FG-GAP-like repeat-containing protein n=1 Tax=Rheinheimera soli TaxID=443616 RepID=UPI001E31989D|nr:FG-GAP-like repeat-containing protein [Rheinheimera soli]
MIKAIFRLIALCALLTSVPVKANVSQYSVFTDAAGNIYLKAPEKFVLIHSDVSVPLFVPPKNGLLKLSLVNGSWVVQELTSSQWNALALTPGNALVDQLRFGDIDGDGVPDLVMSLNNTHFPALSLTNLNSNAVVRSLNTGYLSPAFVLQDVNSDGIMDIVDNNTVFLGQRSGTMLYTGQIKTSADGDNPGLTAAQFRVDESGQATYQIPIVIPAGIAGVQPSVSLSYNSGAGEGIAGMGWNVSGLSSIHRCAKSIVQDGAISGVFMNANDGYCLDGQRLILTDGTYGQAGSTYRLEIDDFSVITAIRQDSSGSGPQGFEVQTKAKETMYFGNTDFSTSDADAFVEPGGKAAGSVASSWALKGIKDGYGNYIEYVYRKGGLSASDIGTVESAGVFVIDSIRYTGTSSSAPFASINFHYDKHPFPRAGFGYGGSFYQKYRLESISVLLDGEAYRYYDLGHDTSQYSYLDWVQECLASDRVSCRNPLTFDYHKQSNTLAFNASESLSSRLKNTTQFFDINGDGRADMVYTSEDGKTLYIKMSKAEGGFGAEEVITSKLASAELINFVDVNGDGNVDIFYPEDSSWKFAIYQPDTVDVPIPCRSKGDSVCTPGKSYSRSYSFTKKTVLGWNYKAADLETYKNRFFADVNGDGLMDWVGFSDESIVAFLNVDKTFSPTQTTVYTVPIEAFPKVSVDPDVPQYRHMNTRQAHVGDFNGDGVSDVVVQLTAMVPRCGTNCPEPKSVLIYSKGAQSFEYQDFSLAGTDHRTADLNGDGLSDLMYIHNNAWKYQLSTGQLGSATSAFSSPVSLNLPAINTTEDYKHLVQLADLDNNGKADILAIESTSIIRYFCRDTGGTIPYSQLMTEGASIAARGGEFEHDGPVCPDLSEARQEPSNSNRVIMLTSTFDDAGNFGFSTVQGLAAFVPVSKQTVVRLADINADGDTDLLFTNSTAAQNASWTAYHNNTSNQQVLSHASSAAELAGIPKHQLKAVTNGFGVKTEISYKPMTDSSVYQAEPTINSSGELNPDYISPKYGMWLVDTVTSQTHSSGSSVETVGVSYNYAGYRLHKKGRGALGFSSLTTRDLQSGIKTTTEYDQNWPFIGRPVKTTSMLGSLLLSEATSTWAQGVSANDGPYVYLEKSVEKGWQIDSADKLSFVSHIETHNSYDKTSTGDSLAGWGNLTKSTVTLYDEEGTSVHSTESIHAYDATNVTDYLRYGRLSASVVTKTQAVTSYQPASTQSRSSTFAYYDSGYLQSETIGSDCAFTAVPENLKSRASTGSYCDSSNISTKTYAYDKYGNIETLTVTASGGSRSETTSYSTDGRFVVTKTNALNQQEHYLYNGQSSARGILYSVTSTGPNGVSSTSHLDGWGQGFQVTSADGNVSTTETLFCSSSVYGGICGTQGLLISKTITPGAPTTFVVTDKYGRKVRQASTTFADANSYSYVDFEYDKHGNLTQQSDPYFNIAHRKLTTFAFDKFQRPTKVTYPGGVTSQVTYWGLRTSTVDENGFWRDEHKDVAGRTIHTTNPYKGSSSAYANLNKNGVEFRYSAFGDLLTQSFIVRTSEYPDAPLPPKPPIDGIDPPKPPIIDIMSSAYSGTLSQVVTITHSYDSYGRKLSTQDATKGTWYYGYNGFGEQIAQLNGRNESSTLEYNQLGQLVAKSQQRSLDEGGGYDLTCYRYGNDPAQKNVGKLIQTVQYSIAEKRDCSELTATAARYSETQSYDVYGRPASSEQKHSGKTFSQSTSYDAYGRVSLQVLPLGRVISLEYQNGYQKGVYEYPARTLLSEVESLDAAGRVTQEKLYGGTSRVTAFDQDRGFIDSITVSKGSLSIYNVSYDYDNKGTTELRTSQYYDQNHVLSQTISEDFVYSEEGHSRLKDRVMTVTNAALGNHVSTITESMGYDGFGNITRKTGTVDNTYTYDQTNPYQLNTVTGNRNYSMVYDAHGNITHDGQREFKYSSSDMPLKIEQNGTITEFAYGPDNQRFYRKDSRTENGVATTTETFYAGKVYEQNHKTTGSQSTASIEHRWYIGPVVITNFESGAEEQYEVLHGDALGSTVAVTDGSGNLKAHYLYDAWGKQSQIMTGFVGANPIAPAASRRAYTGHENVEGLDIIHMNGRIYDATLARFMQADPFVQAPTNTQSYNRYSYVLNNPLSYTDPSGFIFKKLNKMLGKFAPLLGVALLFVPVIGQWAALNMWNAAMYGFMAGGVASGSLKGAVIGAVSGAAFQQIGASFDAKSGFWEAGGVGHVGAHATAGGISSVLQGGKFGHGFVSAGLTKAININSLVGTQQGGLWDQVRISAAAVIGGTISKITGGKFANGAVTAGFAQAFNGNTQAKREQSLKDYMQEKYGNLAISDEERAFAEAGDRKSFWESRLAKGDSVARTAMAIVNDENFIGPFFKGGALANMYTGLEGDALNALGVDLMNAHIDAVDFDYNNNIGIPGLLSPTQAAAYHHDIFPVHGLSPAQFGGTLGVYWGSWHLASSPNLMRGIWCTGCDNLGERIR